MPRHFTVSQSIFKSLPGMKVVVIVANNTPNKYSSTVTEYQKNVWEETYQVMSKYANAQSHPVVMETRELLRKLKVNPKKFPMSNESLLKRAKKDKTGFTINAMVDFYNSVSIKYAVTAGGFDLNELDKLTNGNMTLELRQSTPSDTFIALGSETPDKIEQDEVSYAVGNVILTRHLAWRQSKCGLITEDTQDVMLMAEVMGSNIDERVAAVKREFTEQFENLFGTTPRAFVVEESAPTIEF